MRVDANVSVRPAGSDVARHPVRDQEHQLAALARARHRLRGRAPDRPASSRASASHQETRHWDEDAGPHASRSLQGRGRRLPLLPGARPRARSSPIAEWVARDRRRRSRCCPRRGAPRLAEAAGGESPTSRSSSTAASTSWRWPRSTRARPADGCSSALEHDLAVDGADRARPRAPGAAGHDGGRRRAHRHPGQAGARRHGRVRRCARRHRRRARLRGHGVRPSSKPSSTRSSPPIPTEWDEYVSGDEKRRGKLTGFFVGQVMKATKGQADGKAVTALLEQRRRADGSSVRAGWTGAWTTLTGYR